MPPQGLLGLDRSSWTRVRLGDVADVVIRRIDDPRSSGFERFVSSSDISEQDVTLSRWGHASEYSSAANEFSVGDYLLVRRSLYGSDFRPRAPRASFAGVCSGDIITIREKANVADGFLSFVLYNPMLWRFIKENATGSITQRIKWRQLAEFQFELPPMECQEGLARLLRASEEHRRSVQMLSSRAVEALGAFRDEWFGQQFSNHVDFATLCELPSQNGLSKTKSERSGLVPMINMGQMFRGEVIQEGDFERVALNEKERRAYLLKPGDLLFARRSIVFEGAGATCLVPVLQEEHTFESSIIRATPDQNRVMPEYLLHFFRSHRGRAEMMKIVRRGPVSGIAGSDLRGLKVPLVALSAQRELVGTLSRIRAVSDKVERELEATNVLVGQILVSLSGDG